MPTPAELLNQYRNLNVSYVQDNGERCVETKAKIRLRKYFMMDWDDGSEERTDFDHVIGGGRRHDFYQEHKERIKTAAMGKGSPEDYRLALEWAVRSGKVQDPAPGTIQGFCDQRLGIDCSGFATNYLIANSRKADSHQVKAEYQCGFLFFDLAGCE